MERLRIAKIPILVLLATALAAAGCAGPGPADVPADGPKLSAPAPANLASPKSAVISYLDWTSFAYSIANSDVASHTMSPEEEVRVNSYVELNKEKKRRISQVLVSFKPRAPSVDATHATLGAAEVWDYRYTSADGTKAITETYTASYETTYNLILQKPKSWVVKSVDVRALGQVK